VNLLHVPALIYAGLVSSLYELAMPKQTFAPLSSSGTAPIHLGTTLLLVRYHPAPIVWGIIHSTPHVLPYYDIPASVTVYNLFCRSPGLEQHTWISGLTRCGRHSTFKCSTLRVCGTVPPSAAYHVRQFCTQFANPAHHR
jgi:hypothetical protein